MTALKNKLPTGFILFALLICGLLFTSELVNGRFWLNDFKVYYLSAKAMVEGGQIYGIAHGLTSGFYKYSPFVLLLYVPLTLLPYTFACIIYYWGIVIAVIWIFVLLLNFIKKYFYQEQIKNKGLIFSAIFIFIINLLYRELHLGNTNIFLLLLILLTIKLTLESQFFFAGLLFSLILLFKPFFLIIAIPYILHKKFRLITGATIFMIFQALMLVLIFGWQSFYDMHTEWVKTVAGHSASFPSRNNISYLISHFGAVNLPSSFNYILLLIALSLMVILFIYKNHLDKANNMVETQNNSNFIMETFLIIAILPTLLNTDTEHFLYSLPIIALIAFNVFTNKKPVLFILLFLTFMFYGTNSNDVVGKTIGDFYDEIGAVGISNLVLLIWGYWLYFSNKKTPSASANGVPSK